MFSKLLAERSKMPMYSIPVEKYIEASQVFHWATKRHFQLWFTGKESNRHRRTESVLQKLSKQRKLRSIRYGKKLIYVAPKHVKGKTTDELYGLSKVAHGLACTEGLVRFYRARTDGVVVAERFFYGCGSVPEWGIIYPERRMLLFEYCTKNNFFFSGKIRGKLQAYARNLEKIEEKFAAKALVVFACDVPKGVVENFVLGERHAGSVAGAPPNVFFVDHATFLKVRIGEQLTAPIYYWSDGKQYPLRQNV
ncbi:MAG: hypothetical protein JNM46_00205 [Anaerolineales bacterium]|nr:hypothetical protein [Anaerolineales bacterium]